MLIQASHIERNLKMVCNLKYRKFIVLASGNSEDDLEAFRSRLESTVGKESVFCEDEEMYPE